MKTLHEVGSIFLRSCWCHNKYQEKERTFYFITDFQRFVIRLQINPYLTEHLLDLPVPDKKMIESKKNQAVHYGQKPEK
jgi:hypothetical protein